MCRGRARGGVLGKVREVSELILYGAVGLLVFERLRTEFREVRFSGMCRTRKGVVLGLGRRFAAVFTF